MSVALAEPASPPSYLADGLSLRSWLLTTDHKRIGILYAVTITGFFALGAVAASLMRIQLLHAHSGFLSAENYNKAFTLHGVIMVWFFLIPSIPTVFGNFLLPLMLGARDLAFPRLNLASWYVFLAGGLLTLWAVVTGGVDTGWTFYTPFSTAYSDTRVVATIVGVFVAGFSSIFTGINFLVTTHRLRAPGLTWLRLPIFVWSLYATSLILVLGTPVLAITLALVGIERVFHVGIFDPALGGDPLLFQHLFWFYSHPAVYIMILPGMGVVSEVLPCFARRPLFGYRMVAYASFGIAVIGFLVWGHHMFVSGQSLYASLAFSLLSFLVAVPSAVKVFNWTATLYKGSLGFPAPMLYALGFIGLFTVGGLSGLFLATLPIDVHVTDTYFVVAHFHYIMVGATVMAYLGAVHFWWPKITGRLYPERLARFAAATIFTGFNLTFFPQYLLGYAGMPRRYAFYPPVFQTLNRVSSAGAALLAVGYLLPLVYLLVSLRRGAPAPANPWRATGLEWQVGSPPPRTAYETPPVVVRGPYDYRPDGAMAPQAVVGTEAG